MSSQIKQDQRHAAKVTGVVLEDTGYFSHGYRFALREVRRRIVADDDHRYGGRYIHRMLDELEQSVLEPGAGEVVVEATGDEGGPQTLPKIPLGAGENPDGWEYP